VSKSGYFQDNINYGFIIHPFKHHYCQEEDESKTKVYSKPYFSPETFRPFFPSLQSENINTKRGSQGSKRSVGTWEKCRYQGNDEYNRNCSRHEIQCRGGE